MTDTSLYDLLELQIRRHVALINDLRAVRDTVEHMPEQAGCDSRDHGRGYAAACRRIGQLLDQILEEHANG